MALVLMEVWASFEQEMEDFRPYFHADLARDDSIRTMAERLNAEAPSHFVPIGFSLGGYVAREAASLAPDAVSALVIVATSARAEAIRLELALSEICHAASSSRLLGGN
jgi:pimeloyl-ACP methyl ester carboxylesterase